jgi:hypothetical protein
VDVPEAGVIWQIDRLANWCGDVIRSHSPNVAPLRSIWDYILSLSYCAARRDMVCWRSDEQDDLEAL